MDLTRKRLVSRSQRSTTNRWWTGLLKLVGVGVDWPWMSCKCVALGVGAESRTALPSLRTGENPNTKTTSEELEGLHFSLHLFYWSAVLAGVWSGCFWWNWHLKEQAFSAPLHYLLQGTVIEFFKRYSHQPLWLLLLSSRRQESWKHNSQSIISTLWLAVGCASKASSDKKQVLFNDMFTIITII